MSRTLAHNTGKTPLSELERGLTALYLEAPAVVADDIKRLAHAAITAAEQAAQPQWMPIETAPVGIDILYVWDDGSMNVTRSDPNVGFWYPEPPIAWMPLPAPPAPPSKETV